MLINPRDATLDINCISLIALHLLQCYYTELPLVIFSTGRRHTALSYRVEADRSIGNSKIATFSHPVILTPYQFIEIFMTASVMGVLW